MANWKTGFPQTNLGPNRYIEEVAASSSASGATDPVLVAALKMSASADTSAGDTIPWDATDLPGPYTAATQPNATNAAGVITVSVSGLFEVIASFVLDVATSPTLIDNVLFTLIWGDASSAFAETRIASSHVKLANAASQGPVIGGTVSATVRMSAGDYIRATAYGYANSSTTATYGNYILIQKIEN